MNYSKRGTIFKIVFFTVVTVLVVAMVFSMGDIDDIFGVLGTANMAYIGLAFLFLIAYFLITPITLCLLTRINKTKISWKETFIIGTTEYFFNGITPFATGGQPFQAYSFSKRGVKPSESTGILLMNLVIYQLVVTLFGAIAVIFFYEHLSGIDNIKGFIIFGLSINIVILFGFIGISTLKSVRSFLGKFLHLLCKIRIIKRFLGKKEASFQQYCIDAQDAFRALAKHKKTFLFGFIIKFIGMAFYYAIPFFVLKSLGIELTYDRMFFIIAMTSFALIMVCWFPTPGSSGGIEYAFKLLFVSIPGMTGSVAVAGMLLWRFITYYILLVLSLIMVFIFNKYCSYKNKKEELQVKEEEAKPISEQTSSEQL